MAGFTVDGVLKELKRLGNPKNREGAARFGIATETMLGVPVPRIRALAKKIGRDHSLAIALWGTNVHEARLLAPMIDDPKLVTEKQMDAWAKGFDSWDVCDQCCMNLFDRTPFAAGKIREWSSSGDEFVKRAAFALIASMSVHDKKAGDSLFVSFLPIIKRESTDERNFVRKAVNWALRQIGKRNKALNSAAIRAAEEIAKKDSKAARWIAADALRELRGAAVRKRLRS